MPARKLNIRLLIGLLAGLLLIVPVVHAVHLFQVGRIARDLLQRAEQARASGDQAQALALLKRYLTFDPENPAVLSEYALLLVDSTPAPEARWRLVHTLDQVLQRAPNQTEVRRRLIRLLVELQAPAQALRHINFLLQSEPHNAELLLLRGNCRQSEGDFDGAAESYRQTIAQDSSAIAAYVRLVWLLREQQGEPEQADQLMQELGERNPTQVRAWLEQAAYWHRQGERQQARTSLAKARELAPADADVLLAAVRLAEEDGLAERRARALVQANRPTQREAGLREIEATRRIAPLTLDEHYRLVRLYEQGDNSTTAREQMEELLSRDPKNPTYLAHHIERLLAARDKDETARYLDRLAQLEPATPRVKQFRKELAGLEEK